MKYMLTPENDFEAEAMKANITVKAIFEPILPVVQARALMVAVRLGLFDRIAQGTYTAAGLAETLSLDEDVLRMLLRVLAAAGYLTCSDETYRLTEVSHLSLCSGSPLCLSAWVKLNHIHWDAVAAMETAIRTGQGMDLHEKFAGDEEWGIYQEAMLETARPAAEWVAANVPIAKGANRMLDIGGSHGLYSAAICRRNPPMRSEVLELPEAVTLCRMLARREGIDDIVMHRSGNALTEDLGTCAYDAAFLGNVLHHFTKSQNRELLRRIRRALKNGGTIAVWDLRKPESDSPPDIVCDGFSLLFRITSAGRCYAIEEYSGWMERAGFADIAVVPAPSHALITGRAR